MTRRTPCGTPGPRKRTAPPCHAGRDKPPPAAPAAPWEYTLTIPHDPRSVTVCRRTLRLILTMHGLIGLVDTAELLATELVGNAVRHTEGPAALRVS